jgi:pilus assembly protein CpaE
MPTSVKIRVLIVDDIAETRENIRRLLQFEGDMEVVGAARTGREGIDLAVETKPDVILMDINMPDMDGIAATEAIRKKIPYAQIIILSVQGDPNYMRRAMLAGARDFITKPPLIDELTAAIRRAAVMAQEERIKVAAVNAQSSPGQTVSHPGVPDAHGKIILVYSPKGGTGCTMLAINLAISLQSGDSKVALIDGDLQFGDVAVFLNEQGKNTILDLAPRVDELDPDIIDEVMVTHAASGIKILPAPSRPEMADKITGEQFVRVIQYLRRIFTYIVIDTSSFLSDVVVSAMDIADLLLLVTTQDIPSIKNSKSFLSLADGMRINRQRIVFVMNRYDRKIAITPEKVGESLRHEVSSLIPYDDKIVPSSINRGIPFMLDNKSQPVARSIQELADLVKDKLVKFDAPEPEKPGRK